MGQTLTTNVTTTVTRQVTIQPLTLRKIRLELKAITAVKAQLDALQHAYDKHKAVLGALREETGQQSIEVDGAKITNVQGTSSKLDQKKLVELGCALTWIEEATIVTPSKPYTLVTLPKEQPEI